MNVSNGKCIRDLSRKSLRANRTRNLIAVLAIAAVFAPLLGFAACPWRRLSIQGRPGRDSRAGPRM